jgi:hypothetical protein
VNKDLYKMNKQSLMELLKMPSTVVQDVANDAGQMTTSFKQERQEVIDRFP